MIHTVGTDIDSLQTVLCREDPPAKLTPAFPGFLRIRGILLCGQLPFVRRYSCLWEHLPFFRGYSRLWKHLPLFFRSFRQARGILCLLLYKNTKAALAADSKCISVNKYSFRHRYSVYLRSIGALLVPKQNLLPVRDEFTMITGYGHLPDPEVTTLSAADLNYSVSGIMKRLACQRSAYTL